MSKYLVSRIFWNPKSLCIQIKVSLSLTLIQIPEIENPTTSYKVTLEGSAKLNFLIKSFLRRSRFTMFSNLPFSFIAVVPVTDAEHTLLNVHFSMDPGPNFVWGRDEYDQGKMAGLLQSGKDFFRNGRNTSSNLILMTIYLRGPKLHHRCVIFGQLIRRF